MPAWMRASPAAVLLSWLLVMTGGLSALGSGSGAASALLVSAIALTAVVATLGLLLRQGHPAVRTAVPMRVGPATLAPTRPRASNPNRPGRVRPRAPGA
ncbi:MAG: hypothetical protein ACK5MT_05125 [Actinomycetales bacterium]